MNMYAIIDKKRCKKELTKEEIEYFVNGYTKGDIPDYQAAALAMAICLNGMNEEETTNLTRAMLYSGDRVDLSKIKGTVVDKHSTGGVGDKTTFIISPIVASLGVKVAKMSGRGLGFTGGTIDKIESVKGFKTALPMEEFFDIVNEVGASVISQTGNLAPADKKLYALRDVTATVSSIPLIAASIMSKKIAVGADCILLDVKMGDGAFMKTYEDAKKLSETMVKIGEGLGKRTATMITDMGTPLGNAIGNAVEIIEVCEVLKGRGPKRLRELCIDIAANMLWMANKGTKEECKEMAMKQIENGEAFKTLERMVEAQGGDKSFLSDYSKFDQAKYKYEIKAESSGQIVRMDAEAFGRASVELGAGRKEKGEAIDFAAGIILSKTVGDTVEKGEVIATLLSNDEKSFEAAEKLIKPAIGISQDTNNEIKPLVYGFVSIETIK